MRISCVWPLGASDINIPSTGCSYPLLSDTDVLCGIGRGSKAKATNLHLQWGENSIGLIFCIRPLARPPTPAPSTTSAVQPSVKRPRGILSLSSCRLGPKNKRSFNPHCPPVWGGVCGCKMIQPATLIPPYHFRLHIKNTPTLPQSSSLVLWTPMCKFKRGKWSKEKVATTEQNRHKDSCTEDRVRSGVRPGAR